MYYLTRKDTGNLIIFYLHQFGTVYNTEKEEFPLILMVVVSEFKLVNLYEVELIREEIKWGILTYILHSKYLKFPLFSFYLSLSN